MCGVWLCCTERVCGVPSGQQRQEEQEEEEEEMEVASDEQARCCGLGRVVPPGLGE